MAITKTVVVLAKTVAVTKICQPPTSVCMYFKKITIIKKANLSLDIDAKSIMFQFSLINTEITVIRCRLASKFLLNYPIWLLMGVNE